MNAAKPAPRKTGRPSKYTEELANEILTRIANGESMVKILKDPGMPTQTCVYEWLQKMPSFAEKYARAREDQADTLADEIQA
ncbi:MAG: DNA-binding protein, partial [Caulobacteraceae bacterium]|nr:DNA-binding protein [Caulobacteraceae bacterium]